MNDRSQGGGGQEGGADGKREGGFGFMTISIEIEVIGPMPSISTGPPCLGGIAEKPELLLSPSAARADQLMHPEVQAFGHTEGPFHRLGC